MELRVYDRKILHVVGFKYQLSCSQVEKRIVDKTLKVFQKCW
jgi:hypothetical protein